MEMPTNNEIKIHMPNKFKLVDQLLLLRFSANFLLNTLFSSCNNSLTIVFTVSTARLTLSI